MPVELGERVVNRLASLPRKPNVSRTDLRLFDEVCDFVTGGKNTRLTAVIQRRQIIERLQNKYPMGMVARKFGYDVSDGYSDDEYLFPAA